MQSKWLLFLTMVLYLAALILLPGCTREYEVEVKAEPEHAGEVTGGGTYVEGTDIAVKAEANEGYEFKVWKENDHRLSTSWNYPFVVREDRSLVAIFEEDD